MPSLVPMMGDSVPPPLSELLVNLPGTTEILYNRFKKKRGSGSLQSNRGETQQILVRTDEGTPEGANARTTSERRFT